MSHRKLATGNWKLYAPAPCTLRVRLRACARRQTSVFCGRKKLPFAGYSIVKDRSGGISPRGTLVIAGRFPRTPSLAPLAGPQSPAPFRSRQTFCDRCSHAFAADTQSRQTIGRAGGCPSERKRQGVCKTKQSGEYRARTGDLLVANQALSQLS
jgi:hypothetical protein